MAWCYPCYGESSFDVLPDTIEQLLTGRSEASRYEPLLERFGAKSAERVVLVYLDAFGWERADRHREHSLLQRAGGEGLIARLTSQFPSTTTVHTTTIHTGLPVAGHGLYEWFVYEPLLVRMICPLFFSFAGDKERGTLPLAPSEVFPTTSSVYRRLGNQGVSSHVVLHDSLSGTPPTRLLMDGAQVHGFSSDSEMVERVCAALSSCPITGWRRSIR